jgi:hypothetical protein
MEFEIVSRIDNSSYRLDPSRYSTKRANNQLTDSNFDKNKISYDGVKRIK